MTWEDYKIKVKNEDKDAKGILETAEKNAAVMAMTLLQHGMAGEAERAGFHSEEDVVTLVKEIRSELHDDLSVESEHKTLDLHLGV